MKRTGGRERRACSPLGRVTKRNTHKTHRVAPPPPRARPALAHALELRHALHQRLGLGVLAARDDLGGLDDVRVDGERVLGAGRGADDDLELAGRDGQVGRLVDHDDLPERLGRVEALQLVRCVAHLLRRRDWRRRSAADATTAVRGRVADRDDGGGVVARPSRLVVIG